MDPARRRPERGSSSRQLTPARSMPASESMGSAASTAVAGHGLFESRGSAASTEAISSSSRMAAREGACKGGSEVA